MRGISIEKCTGRGAGLNDMQLNKKIEILSSFLSTCAYSAKLDINQNVNVQFNHIKIIQKHVKTLVCFSSNHF